MANEIGAAVIPITFDLSLAERRRAERAAAINPIITPRVNPADLNALRTRIASRDYSVRVRADEGSLRSLRRQVSETLRRARDQSPFRVALAFGPEAGGALARSQIFRDLLGPLIPQRRPGLGGALAFGGGLLGVGAVGLGIAGFALTSMTEEIRILQGRIREFARSTSEGNIAFRQLTGISNATGQSIRGLGDFYQRLLPIYENHSDQIRRAGNIVEAVALAFRIEGTQAREAGPLLFQLQQGLRQGAFGGRELRTLFERSPILTQLFEESAQQAGFRSAREAGAANFFTAGQVQRIFEQAVEGLRERAQDFDPTLGQARNRLTNEVTLTANAIASGTVSRTVVSFVDSIAFAARGIRIAAENLFGTDQGRGGARGRQDEDRQARTVGEAVARAIEPRSVTEQNTFLSLLTRGRIGGTTRAEPTRQPIIDESVFFDPVAIPQRLRPITPPQTDEARRLIAEQTRANVQFQDAVRGLEATGELALALRADRSVTAGVDNQAVRAFNSIEQLIDSRLSVGGLLGDGQPAEVQGLPQQGRPAPTVAEQQAEQFEARIESLGQTFSDSLLSVATFEDSFTGFISNIARSIARFTLQQGADQLGQGLAGFIGGIIQNQTVNNFNSEVPSSIDQINAGTNALLVQPQATIGT